MSTLAAEHEEMRKRWVAACEERDRLTSELNEARGVIARECEQVFQLKRELAEANERASKWEREYDGKLDELDKAWKELAEARAEVIRLALAAEESSQFLDRMQAGLEAAKAGMENVDAAVGRMEAYADELVAARAVIARCKGLIADSRVHVVTRAELERALNGGE